MWKDYWKWLGAGASGLFTRMEEQQCGGTWRTGLQLSKPKPTSTLERLTIDGKLSHSLKLFIHGGSIRNGGSTDPISPLTDQEHQLCQYRLVCLEEWLKSYRVLVGVRAKLLNNTSKP